MASKVILDTVDPNDPNFQQYLREHGISATVVSTDGEVPEVEYTGSGCALLALIVDWFSPFSESTK